MKKIVERSREESEMREKKPSAHPSRGKEKGLALPPRGALNQKGLRYQYPRGFISTYNGREEERTYFQTWETLGNMENIQVLYKGGESLRREGGREMNLDCLQSPAHFSKAAQPRLRRRRRGRRDWEEKGKRGRRRLEENETARKKKEEGRRG